jgi:hypothetical protein
MKMVCTKVNGQSHHSLGLIAGLGLLLLISAFGKETGVPAVDVNATVEVTWSSKVRSLIGDFVKTVQSQYEAEYYSIGSITNSVMGKQDSKEESTVEFPTKANSKEAPLEEKEAQAVDDGKGNVFSSDLVHAIQMQKKKTQVNESQAKENNHLNSLLTHKMLMDDDHNQVPKMILGKEKKVAYDDSPDKGYAVSTTALQFPNGCQHKYPGEWFYKDKGSKSKKYVPEYEYDNDGKLILPIIHPSCQNIMYIWSEEEISDDNEWTCPQPFLLFLQLWEARTLANPRLENAVEE